MSADVSDTEDLKKDQVFFKQTGYHKSFLITSLSEIIDKKFDDSSEFSYAAFWDSTTEVKVIQFLAETSPTLPVALLKNLHEIEKPRLFEITCGILGNILSSGYFVLTEDILQEGFLDIIENLLYLDIGSPEAFVQIVRTIHIVLGRVTQGVNVFKLVPPLLFLLESAYNVELLTQATNLLYTIKSYGDGPFSYPIDPFLTAVNEIRDQSPEKLLDFDTPLLIFPDNNKLLLIYQQTKTQNSFVKVSEGIEALILAYEENYIDQPD